MTLTDNDRDTLCQELLKRLFIDDEDVPERHALNLRKYAAGNFRQEILLLERMQHPVAAHPGVRGKLFQAVKDIANNGDIVGKITNTRAAIIYIFHVFWASYSQPVSEQEILQEKALQYLYDTYPVIEMGHYQVPLPGGQYE